MKKILILIFLSISTLLFAQKDQLSKNETKFNTVFKELREGHLTGTANGVFFIKNTDGKEIILDFQGSEANLVIEKDPDEVYDISFKRYKAQTTSGKSKIEYTTYAFANSLTIKLSNQSFRIGVIDGACDDVIKGFKYYYKAEKETEYLIVKTEKELTLINYDEKSKNALQSSIILLPNSTLMLAINRNK